MRSRHTEGARLEEERPTDGEEMAEDNDQGAAPDEDEDEKGAQKWYTTLPAILGAATALVAAIGGVLALVLDNDDSTAPPSPSSPSAGVARETASEPPPTQPPPPPVTGANASGWIDYPYAQCEPGHPPAALALTTQSALVICQTGPGNFYYRGVRTQGGTGIELANAVRSSDGFDVKNPIDGTRYQVRSVGLSILLADGKVFSEPILRWWSR
jgi:hypothetical protein